MLKKKMVISKKICLLGDPSVGKTSLVRRFVYSAYDDKYISTIGTKVMKKEVEFEEEDTEATVRLMIWDIAGQHSYQFVKKAYYDGAEAALIVSDTTRRETLESFDNWVESIFSVTGKIPIIMLGNKCDMPEKAQFTLDDLKNIGAKYNCPCFLTSAKTGANVEESFRSLAKILFEEYKSKSNK